MNPKYQVIYTANGQLEAETIRLFLESNGIEAFISQESAGVTYGLTVGPLGQAKVYVLTEQINEANHLLEQMDRGEFILPGEDHEDDEDEESDF